MPDGVCLCLKVFEGTARRRMNTPVNASQNVENRVRCSLMRAFHHYIARRLFFVVRLFFVRVGDTYIHKRYVPFYCVIGSLRARVRSCALPLRARA